MSLLHTMSPSTGLAQPKRNKDKELGHRLRVIIAMSCSILLVLSIAGFGANYYLLPLDQRPFSEKHELLKPSGSIGLRLGILGTVLFFIIFLYALRKVVPWLGQIGSTRHWMDFHVIAGITAPIIIAFHASFKFGGIAGFAFWIMVAVAISGVVGRYLYSQIPRSLSAVEMSLTEVQENERELAEFLLVQSVFSEEELSRALRVPSREQIRKAGPIIAIISMIHLDIAIPFRMARLRRKSGGRSAGIGSLFGLLRTGNYEVDRIVGIVRQKASLSKRVVFLDQTQRVFHLWHVIHRPFSYAFAILAIIHIVVVMGLGFGTGGLR